MPGGFARSRPQTKQQNRGSSHVSDSSSRPGPCRPPLLALLCNSHGWPAAPQREAFILGHKAHQIQLFWKGWAVFPAPKGYSHALNPAVILLPPVFSLWCLFLSFGGGRSPTCRPSVERHFTPCVFFVFSSVLLLEWTFFHLLLFGTGRLLPVLQVSHAQLPECPLCISAWFIWSPPWPFIERGCQEADLQGACVSVYCEECNLNRTCHTQQTNLKLRATIVFFSSLPHICTILIEKERKSQVTASALSLFFTSKREWLMGFHKRFLRLEMTLNTLP